MTLRYATGWDNMGASEVGFEWVFVVNNGNTYLATGGRNGGSMLVADHTSNYAYNIWDGLTARDTWIVGTAFQCANLAAVRSDVISLLDAGGNVHVAVYVDTDRKLYVRNGNGTVLLGPGPAMLSDNVWYYIEMKAKIHDSTGTAEVRLNTSSVQLTGTGLDTRNGGAAAADRILLSSAISSLAIASYFDDFYACDDQGSVNNDFLGDITIQSVFPNGNGNSSMLVGSDGNSTDNYLLVDENPANGDTDYVSSATVNDKDTYAMGAITPTAGTIYAIKTKLVVRKDDAGARNIASVVRLAGTEDTSADKTLSTTYQPLYDIHETKPGGGAWTVSDVNAMEVGVKVTL